MMAAVTGYTVVALLGGIGIGIGLSLIVGTLRSAGRSGGRTSTFPADGGRTGDEQDQDDGQDQDESEGAVS